MFTKFLRSSNPLKRLSRRPHLAHAAYIPCCSSLGYIRLSIHTSVTKIRMSAQELEPSIVERESTDMEITVESSTPFVDVLEDLSIRAGENNNVWKRPVLHETFLEEKPSLTFQHIDIRESGLESSNSEIHLFGVTKAGHSILARVRGFQHYFYYPAPVGLDEEDLEPLRDYINTTLKSGSSSIVQTVELEDQSTIPDAPPLSFLKVHLADHKHIQHVKTFFASGNCQYRDLFTSPEVTYESKIPYSLRFMIDNQINAMSWLKIPSGRYEVVPNDEKISHSQIEVITNIKSLMICDTLDNKLKFPPLRILSFDIETFIPRNGGFSNARYHPVIQISNMVSTYGQETPVIRNVFTLGTCSPIAGTQVLSFKRETDMLSAWHNFFKEVDPDIVIGYNITQFDIPYLINRSQALRLSEFPFLGRVKGSSHHLNDWKASFMSCPGYEGRALLDVFHHIREHHPGLPGTGAYKLNAVASHFLGQQKEDIHYTQIPILQGGTADTRRELAIYCLKDAYLPLLLLTKLKCFEKEVKEAKEAYVPYNAMRTARPLKALAKRYLNAVDQQYIIPDLE